MNLWRFICIPNFCPFAAEKENRFEVKLAEKEKIVIFLDSRNASGWRKRKKIYSPTASIYAAFYSNRRSQKW